MCTVASGLGLFSLPITEFARFAPVALCEHKLLSFLNLCGSSSTVCRYHILCIICSLPLIDIDTAGSQGRHCENMSLSCLVHAFAGQMSLFFLGVLWKSITSKSPVLKLTDCLDW